MAVVEHSTDVVGVGFRMKHDVRVALAGIIKKNPLRVDLMREPDNEYDPNAIAVYISDSKAGALDGHHLGYLARSVSEVLAPKLDAGKVVVEGGLLTHLYPKQGDKRDDLSTGNLDLILVRQ